MSAPPRRALRTIVSATSDQSARAAALDPRRSFIVQAPAGSGKTELLTQRYLRLLAAVEAPEQILAITFTRKAAAEMRQRVLKALASAAGAPPEAPHKRTTWELARAARAADERKQWRLAQHPSRLRVQTIDALNASLARRLPILAGAGAAIEPTDDPWPLYEAACTRLIERLGDGSDVARDLERLIAHLANRVDRVVALVSELLAKRDQWLHPIVHARRSANLRAALERALRAVVQRHLTALCARLGEARGRELLTLAQFAAGNLLGNDGLAAVRRRALEECLSCADLGPRAECLPAWRAVGAMLFKQNDELYASVNVLQGFPKTHPEIKARMLSFLREIRADETLCGQLFELRTLPDPAYAEDQWRMLEALLELLPAAVAELQLVFQARGEADYIEAALRALAALGSPDEPTDLALAFDFSLQHILVDEFQDTSFAQLDLLERLTAGWTADDGRTLFCVGDPMQSIYRFRQAEVGLFLNLQQHGLGALRLETLTLTANFRSDPAVVEWLNATFPDVFASRNDPEQGAVAYSPSVAARGAGAGAVHVHALVNADAGAEAIVVRDLIQDALESDPVGSIAVLAAARTHVDAIARELTAAGVPFQAVEIERLRERPLVQDLVALTRALVHLGDRTAWLAVLRAPWCGLTLPDLHAVALEEDATICDNLGHALQDGRLAGEAHRRAARTFEVLSAALTERGRWPLRIWVERAWNALGGPATAAHASDLDDAEAYFSRLDQIETAGDLEDVARLEDQLHQLFAHSRPQGRAQVELMTIHAAKGLEFETVIVPGLQRTVRGDSRELLRWTRIAGEEGGIVLAPLRAEGADPDSIYRWIELLEQQRLLRERARLLYVATTRAKRVLHLLGTARATVREDATAINEPPKGSMLRMLWRTVAPRFEAAAPEAQATPALGAAPPQRLRRLPLAWSAPATPVAIAPSTPALVDLEIPRLEFDWVSEISRRVGTLVHRELDRITRTSKAAVAHRESARTRIMMELAELGVPSDRSEAACERVLLAVERTLADERGRWLLGLGAPIKEAESELALSGALGDLLVTGVIDRTLIDAHGVRWIIDFKTSTHEGGGLDAFLDREVERYRPQLARYAQLLRLYKPAEAVKAALYFPLLRQWREVDV
jgi:ATP-dependent exoDNAse (exonuclease V) beta subunit